MPGLGLPSWLGVLSRFSAFCLNSNFYTAQLHRSPAASSTGITAGLPAAQSLPRTAAPSTARDCVTESGCLCGACLSLPMPACPCCALLDLTLPPALLWPLSYVRSKTYLRVGQPSPSCRVLIARLPGLRRVALTSRLPVCQAQGWPAAELWWRWPAWRRCAPCRPRRSSWCASPLCAKCCLACC